MKKSYKLFGTLWDRIDEPDEIFYMNDDDFIYDINDEYNLFDYNGIRRINISNIFKIEDIILFNDIVNNMRKYNSILICIDYIPTTDNKILLNFYKKRIRQIYYYLNEQLLNTEVYISSNYDKL